ncbi:MAG TPA: iron-containing alcohol dehydrogenase [Deltaproteobacteria bacterium]|nr:iron-containing alcohol dehydrogenase [Deltaproteobacteria bacterium]HPR50532.1 iron-containing alcohol dehydrogenase [Deltaproteobacteria bacterium]
MKFNYFMPTRLIFGVNSLRKLIRSPYMPGTKALVVIGAGGAMRRNGYIERVIEYLDRRKIESVVFDKILANPISEHVDEGAGIAREHQCDVVLGLGGGSTIDSAKSIALMAANPGTYWDYIWGGSGGNKVAPNAALPIVAIPTTAGTGTEVDPWTVITKTQTNEKIGWGRDDTFPALAIVDPELMLSVPPKTTAYTGMDAFFHAVEAYLATISQPTSDMLALEAIGIIAQNLPKAVEDGNDIEARTRLAWASTAAGICESLSSCISHHSMEHAMSAYHPDLPHGAGLTLLSRAYFTYLAEKVPGRFVPLARAIGGDHDAESEKDAPAVFMHGLDRLIESIGLKEERLSDYGITREEIGIFAQNAFATMGGLFQVTPVKMSMDDVVGIYETAFS